MTAAAAMPREAVTGLVLAGGEGRRMGGADKGLVLWQGRPLAAHALARLAPQVGSTVVSANRNRDAYAALGVPVWADAALAAGIAGTIPAGTAPPAAGTAAAESASHAVGDLGIADAAAGEPRFLGPLAGILAGLREARTPWLAVVPCDAPLFPADLVARLAAGRGRAPIAYARAARSHPVFCLIATELADELERSLVAGERRVERWLREHGGVEVGFDDEAAFANFNSPENLADDA